MKYKKGYYNFMGGMLIVYLDKEISEGDYHKFKVFENNSKTHNRKEIGLSINRTQFKYLAGYGTPLYKVLRGE